MLVFNQPAVQGVSKMKSKKLKFTVEVPMTGKVSLTQIEQIATDMKHHLTTDAAKEIGIDVGSVKVAFTGAGFRQEY